MKVAYPLESHSFQVKENAERLEDTLISRRPTSVNSRHPKCFETAKNFVLFVRLPNWKKSDSSKNLSEIRTLRHLKNGIEAFQIKVSLEITTGFPAHITTLYNTQNEEVADDTKLILSKNVVSGNTFRLEIVREWEDIVKIAWTGALPTKLLYRLPPYKSRYENTSAWSQFTFMVKIAGKESAFYAIFAAASRGNVTVCKAILDSDVDLNQATFFGNNCLHCAAFNGHLEVIQLLVSHGVNIRARNVQGKSALDLAVSAEFIDCARWLWLNQWSISITKADIKPESKVDAETGKVSPRVHFSPSKPLAECHTLFRKSPKFQQPLLDEKSSNVYDAPLKRKSTLNVKKSINRPNTSPAFLKTPSAIQPSYLAAKDNVPHKYSNVQQYAAARERPIKSAVIRRHPGGTAAQTSSVPKLLPQLSAALTQGRSIPSVQESRFSPHNHGHLRVDVKPRIADEALRVNITLNQKWINPETPDVSASVSPAPSVSTTESNQLNSSFRDSSTSQIFKERPHTTLHSFKYKTSSSTSSNASDKIQKPITSVSITTRPVSAGGQLGAGSDLGRDNYTSECNNEVETESKGSRESRDVAPKEKFSRGENRPPNPPSFGKPTLKTTPPVLKPANYDQFKRTKPVLKKTDSELRQEAVKIRNETLRKERNKTAWNEWMAAKQRQKIASKKAEEEEKRHEHVARKWGMTFEEWLETKREEMKKNNVSPETNRNEPVKRPPAHSTNGIKFEEWLKQKSQANSLNNNNEDKKVTEEQQKNIEEMRRKKFEAWKAKKQEEAKKERQEADNIKEKKLKEEEALYSKWKSKDRVMSFESWRKKKEKAKKLNEADGAQREAMREVEAYAALERREEAETAYKKWMLRKESMFLEEAEKELKEAKLLREKSERKAKIKRALLKAKALAKMKKRLKNKKFPEISESSSSSSDDEEYYFLSDQPCPHENQNISALGASRNFIQNIEQQDEGFSETEVETPENWKNGDGGNKNSKTQLLSDANKVKTQDDEIIKAKNSTDAEKSILTVVDKFEGKSAKKKVKRVKKSKKTDINQKSKAGIAESPSKVNEHSADQSNLPLEETTAKDQESEEMVSTVTNDFKKKSKTKNKENQSKDNNLAQDTSTHVRPKSSTVTIRFESPVRYEEHENPAKPVRKASKYSHVQSKISSGIAKKSYTKKRKAGTSSVKKLNDQNVRPHTASGRKKASRRSVSRKMSNRDSVSLTDVSSLQSDEEQLLTSLMFSNVVENPDAKSLVKPLFFEAVEENKDDLKERQNLSAKNKCTVFTDDMTSNENGKKPESSNKETVLKVQDRSHLGETKRTTDDDLSGTISPIRKITIQVPNITLDED